MTSSSETLLPASRLGPAVGFLAGGMLLASLSGALLKVMASEMHPVFLAAGRYFFYLVCIAPIAYARHGSEVLLPSRSGAQAFRAVMILAATLFFILAVGHMPLATSIAIVYVYPFLIAGLSPFILGERVPMVAWLGVAAGFTGVVVVMRPDVSGITPAALMALASGATYAIYLMFTRKLAASAPPLVSTAYLAVVSTVILIPGAVWYWQTPSLHDMAMLALMGLVNAAAHYVILMAFARAPASSLAPFAYAELVWAVMWGVVFFGDLPDAVTFAGIGLIIASGVMVAQSGRIGRLIARRRGTAG
jgi:drug/metabolite transporter (DMT)-like permease